MHEMKSRIWLAGVGLCLVLGAAWPAGGAEYYVDDGSDAGDLWTPGAIGNDVNNGSGPATPKATLANVIGTCNLQPGDVVFLDTGSYAPLVISNTVVGTSGNPVVIQGSTNAAGGGTVFLATGSQ